MEFWGVEVLAGEPKKVNLEQGELIHLSQVTFSGEKGEKVLVFLKIGEKKHLGGTLIQGRIPQLTTDLVLHTDFELSHNRAKGSVHFLGSCFLGPDVERDEPGASDPPSFCGVPFHNCEQDEPLSDEENEDPADVGYAIPASDEDDSFAEEEDSGEENVEPVPPGAAASNVVKADQKQKAKVADLKPGSDDSDASSDEEKESSDDSEEDCGEEEETPKQPEPSHKKRASESASKAHAPKKAKTAAAVTPQKREEKKKEGHTAKEKGNSKGKGRA